MKGGVILFPKIPKELILQLEHAKRINKMYQNFLSKENITHIQLAVQQQKQLDTQVIQNLASAAKQFQMYDNLIPNYNGLNEALNSIISAYETSKNNEFEITIENVPICIPKTKVDEYIDKFKSLKVPDSVAVKLAFISYLILRFAPLIYILPALIPFMEFLLKLFIIYGRPYIKELSKFQKPEILAEKLADNTFSIVFSSVISIIGSLFIMKNKK